MSGVFASHGEENYEVKCAYHSGSGDVVNTTGWILEGAGRPGEYFVVDLVTALPARSFRMNASGVVNGSQLYREGCLDGRCMAEVLPAGSADRAPRSWELLRTWGLFSRYRAANFTTRELGRCEVLSYVGTLMEEVNIAGEDTFNISGRTPVILNYTGRHASKSCLAKDVPLAVEAMLEVTGPTRITYQGTDPRPHIEIGMQWGIVRATAVEVRPFNSTGYSRMLEGLRMRARPTVAAQGWSRSETPSFLPHPSSGRV